MENQLNFKLSLFLEFNKKIQPQIHSIFIKINRLLKIEMDAKVVSDTIQ